MKRALMILFAMLCGTAQAGSISTPAIVASVASPDCLDYQITGICFWLKCNPKCKIRTSIKVKHFVPDAVVSSYHRTGGNPWIDMALLSPPIPGAEGGGNLITPARKRDNLPRFKHTDAYGHPGLLFFSEVFAELGYMCTGAGVPMMPYFNSNLDQVAWRWGVPEQVYPEALIPLMREVGSTLGGNMWGNIYPRHGFLVQPDDFKAAAVMAQRTADVITRTAQPHVYVPLVASRKAGYWPPGPVVENSSGNHKWQLLVPRLEMHCGVFPNVSVIQDEEGDYAWSLWRPYECCKRRGIFLYSVDF